MQLLNVSTLAQSSLQEKILLQRLSQMKLQLDALAAEK